MDVSNSLPGETMIVGFAYAEIGYMYTFRSTGLPNESVVVEKLKCVLWFLFLLAIFAAYAK